jgi:hypothetical protein
MVTTRENTTQFYTRLVNNTNITLIKSETKLLGKVSNIICTTKIKTGSRDWY